MALTVYLGIDVGSVTTKLALVDENGKYVDSYMLRTAGKPVMAVQEGLKHLKAQATQEYDVKGTGILYASYQHAMSTISLPSSKCYTVNFGGYGGVFDFYGNAYGVYDQMAGVETSFN